VNQIELHCFLWICDDFFRNSLVLFRSLSSYSATICDAFSNNLMVAASCVVLYIYVFVFWFYLH
jgi:hypothetical protein